MSSGNTRAAGRVLRLTWPNSKSTLRPQRTKSSQSLTFSMTRVPMESPGPSKLAIRSSSTTIIVSDFARCKTNLFFELTSSQTTLSTLPTSLDSPFQWTRPLAHRLEAISALTTSTRPQSRALRPARPTITPSRTGPTSILLLDNRSQSLLYQTPTVPR